MRDTPETDAEAASIQLYYSHGEVADAVHADFARRLERQRDILRQLLEKIAKEAREWERNPRVVIEWIADVATSAIEELTPKGGQP